MSVNSRELQRLWLDARCASVGASGQAAKMNAFLVSFLSNFATRHDPDFRRIFGAGTDLAQLVCRSFSHEAKAAAPQAAHISATTTTYMHALLATLVILVSGFTVEEVTYFAPLYELLADSAIITSALMLHRQLSGVASLSDRAMPDTASPDLVALECLKLTSQILTCPHEGLVRRCLLEASQPANVAEVCRVLRVSVQAPYRMSDAECPLAQGYVRRISSVAVAKTLESALASLEEALVTCNSPATERSAAASGTYRSGFAVSLACLMETIVLLYNVLEWPFRDHFSFGAFASCMISAEDIFEVNPKCLLRIVTCIETVATSLIAPEPQSAAASPASRQGLLKFVPGSIQTLKQKFVDATTSTAAKSVVAGGDGVTCPEAFECLVTLFICSTQPLTAKYYGESVMKLLQLPSASTGLADFFLRSGQESIASLQAQQLALVFETAVMVAPAAHDSVGRFVAAVVRALGRQGVATVERRSLTVDFLTTVSEASQDYKAIVLHEGGLCACLTGMVEVLKGNPTEAGALLSKASILSKVLVDGPSCAEDLAVQRYPTQVIDCMLACYAADLSSATLVLRDMFTNVVSKTGQFFSPLMVALASTTQGKPWRPETSLLLATFVTVIQRGKHIEKAVDSNAVELLLTLMCQINTSTAPNLDMHLIATTLAFLFRLLRFSDVWVLFDATVTPLQPEPALVQMVIDLCCGFFYTAVALRRCYAVFDGATAASQNAAVLERTDHAVFGVYHIPTKPFVELDYPLRTLVRWCEVSDSDSNPTTHADPLCRLLEFLFANSARRFDNDVLIPFLTRHRCMHLLSRVANVTDRRVVEWWRTRPQCPQEPFTKTDATSVQRHQEAWCAALQVDTTTTTTTTTAGPSTGDDCGFSRGAEPSRVLLLGEGGGVSGAVACTEEQWPSRDGYSAAIWVRWSALPSASGSGDGGSVTPVWRLAWTNNRKTYTVKLMLSPADRTAVFCCDGGESTSKMRAPRRAVKSDVWTHIVVVHERSSFNASQAAMFVNGRRVVAAQCSFPAPSWQPSFQSSVLGSAQTEIACSIGSSIDRPTTGVRLDLTSWTVFNQALTVDEITSLFCCGVQSTNGQVWSPRSGKTEFPLSAPTYRSEVVRGLEMCALAGSLHIISHGNIGSSASGPDAVLTMAAPSSHVVFDVDVRSLAPRDVHETHFHSQEWSLRSVTAASAPTLFTLHGAWSAGVVDSNDSNPVNTMLTHGGTREWSRWMRWIRESPCEGSDAAAVRRDAASKLVQVLASCRFQGILAPSTWGDVLVELADCVTAVPAVFLGTESERPQEVIEHLLSLSVSTVDVGSGRSATIVHSVPLLEHLLFNWHVLVSANIVSLTSLLSCFTSLIEPTNPFFALNAQRFRQANFEDGFVYGLFMEWIPPFVLHSATRLVGLYVRAIAASTEEPISDLLTLCALSVPNEAGECRLGSLMVQASPSYVALVRNLLLRVVHEVCCEAVSSMESGSEMTASTYPELSVATFENVCEMLPPCWFSQMMTPASHPVTVILACHLFVLCFHHSGTFRTRHAEAGSVCFESAVSHFAHNEELSALFLDGFAGRVARPFVVTDLVSSRQTVPSTWGTANMRQRYAPLLALALALAKAQAEALLNDQFYLYSSPIAAASYFSDFVAQASRTCARVSKLRRCCLAVQFCVRLRTRGRGTALMDAASISKPPVTVSGSSLRRPLAQLMTQIIHLLASSYDAAPTLRSVLYAQNAPVNRLDTVMWPVLSSIRAIPGTDVTALPAPPDLADIEPRDDVVEVLEVENALEFNRSGAESRTATAAVASHSNLSDDDDDTYELDEDTTWRDGDAVVLASAKTGICSLPFLDSLAPREQMESVFEASRSLFLVHARCYVRQTDLIAVTTGKTNLSGFVLALHRALMAQPVALGTQTESLRAAFLCTTWIKAAEQALDAASTEMLPTSLVKNVMALGKYMLSRMVAGLAVPPETVARHFRFLLLRFERHRELVRFARTALFEWFMFVVNKLYFQTNSDVACGVVNMVAATCAVLLEHAFPTTEMAQTVALRLIELTLVVLTDPIQAETVSKKLCTIWTSYLNAHKQSPSVSFLFVGDGATDAWLLSPSSSTVTSVQCPTWETFKVWFNRFHVGFLQILRAQSLTFQFSIAETDQHLKMVRTSERQRGDELRHLLRRQATAVQGAAAEWAFYQSTATVVDPVFLRTRADARDAASYHCDEVLASPLDGGSWTLLSSGEVSRLPSRLDDSVACNGWRQQPLRRFLRFPPPPCIPVRTSIKDTKVGPCRLRRNAANLLTRLASAETPATALWVGNVYHIVGIDAYISTLVLTERELLIVRCSQVTPDGDFFIARIQPHAASARSRKLKENTIYSTLRRFLPGHATTKTGTTQSAAAFRFSQYFRQLRADVSGAESATVCRIPLANVTEAHERLFLHLPAAMEFVLESDERLLVVVLDEELAFSRPALQSLTQVLQERVERVRVDTMAAKRSRLASVTRQWVTREIGNQRYLTVLNDTASRTMADLSQYPVMPWVLSDYTSSVLTLSEPSVYRSLGTPVGALDPARAQQLRERFRDWVVESGEPPFHFGTHYSTSAIVMYFLVRLEPLTTWSRRFQGGKLDLPDRLFHSVREAWESSSGNKSGDVKELIPEFFNLSVFLSNRNALYLGERRDGTRLGDVVLPPWALNAPHRFIHFNALALESEEVSAHLNEWIDLIFGFKQQGDDAVKAVNVFSYTSYRDGVESAINRAATEEDRKAIVASVDNFGQTPLQLFTGHAAHPARARADGCGATQQQYLLQHLHELRLVNSNAASSAGSRAYAVSQLVYVEPQEQLLSCSWLETACPNGPDGSPQLFIYDTCRDTVQCYLRRPGRLLAVTPSIESVGCGQYTAMCSTSSGNVLFVGTDTGAVIAFSRRDSRGGYACVGLLPPPSSTNRVTGLQVFHDHRLVVYHEGEALIRCWSLSYESAAFEFEVHLLNPSDDSPVTHTALLNDLHVFVAAKSQSLCIFGFDGTVLAIIPRTDIIDNTTDAPTSTPFTDAAITAVCVFNCDSFDTQNVLFLGHADGTISALLIEAAHNTTDAAALFTVKYVTSTRINAAVTCLCAMESGCAVAVGGADGKTRLYRFPTADQSDRD